MREIQNWWKNCNATICEINMQTFWDNADCSKHNCDPQTYTSGEVNHVVQHKYKYRGIVLKKIRRKKSLWGQLVVML